MVVHKHWTFEWNCGSEVKELDSCLTRSRQHGAAGKTPFYFANLGHRPLQVCCSVSVLVSADFQLPTQAKAICASFWFWLLSTRRAVDVAMFSIPNMSSLFSLSLPFSITIFLNGSISGRHSQNVHTQPPALVKYAQKCWHSFFF